MKKAERFSLEQLSNGIFEARHNECGLVVTFREHQLTETHRIAFESDGNTPYRDETKSNEDYLNELTFWLMHDHYETCRPAFWPRRVAFGQRIKELREEMGMSIEDLSVLVGIKPGNIASIEAGKYNMGVTTILRFADALGVQLQLI